LAAVLHPVRVGEVTADLRGDRPQVDRPGRGQPELGAAGDLDAGLHPGLLLLGVLGRVDDEPALRVPGLRAEGPQLVQPHLAVAEVLGADLEHLRLDPAGDGEVGGDDGVVRLQGQPLGRHRLLDRLDDVLGPASRLGVAGLGGPLQRRQGELAALGEPGGGHFPPLEVGSAQIDDGRFDQLRRRLRDAEAELDPADLGGRHGQPAVLRGDDDLLFEEGHLHGAAVDEPCLDGGGVGLGGRGPRLVGGRGGGEDEGEAEDADGSHGRLLRGRDGVP
jgi:hypothetical protein